MLVVSVLDQKGPYIAELLGVPFRILMQKIKKKTGAIWQLPGNHNSSVKECTLIEFMCCIRIGTSSG